MEIGHIIPHIEALIFASEKPLTFQELTDLVNGAFGFMEDKISIEQIAASMEGIVEKYNAEFYPFEVRESGGGWQFLTKRDFHKTVAQLNGDKFMKKLSAAAMETLAIIAYKQPIAKSEIESIRGVSSDYAVQKLLEKELVVISGRNDEAPGRPLLYSTSKTFMDYFGINSPEELPKIREILSEQAVEPTTVTGENTELVQGDVAVKEDGELVREEPGENPVQEITGEAAEINSETAVPEMMEEASTTEEPEDIDGEIAEETTHIEPEEIMPDDQSDADPEAGEPDEEDKTAR